MYKKFYVITCKCGWFCRGSLTAPQSSSNGGQRFMNIKYRGEKLRVFSSMCLRYNKRVILRSGAAF